MIKLVDQTELVLSTSEALKGTIEMPEWAQFVKTGTHRETLPKNPNWWYIRAASILRVINEKGPVGVGKLRVRYGGRQNRGVRPDRFAQASGKVIRTILQQLETAELIKQASVGTHKGRIITPKGVSLLAQAAKGE
jgi:small subunit ribosomal protein S19e